GALLAIARAPQGTGFAGDTFAKMPDSWADIFEDGVRKDRPSRGDGKGVQGRQRATDRGKDLLRVLRHRRRHRLAGLVRQQQETAWRVVREDARNRETGFDLTVRPQLGKDGGDSTGIVIPIVEFPYQTVST